jgi:hypothetical protein
MTMYGDSLTEGENLIRLHAASLDLREASVGNVDTVYFAGNRMEHGRH